jgi:flavin reductase (DIM6/NTAB) family NADH-FMN oxidoreductase RutF
MPMYYDPRRNNHGFSHNPMTALVVPRPIGWISTVNRSGVVNLAPYSFFNVVSGAPPFVMFASKPRKDSQRNAEETGEFVYNMATYDLREAVNASSAEFGPAISEPERIGLEMVPCREVKSPRVSRSPVILECKYFKTVELVSSDGTRSASSVIIGEVVGVHIDDAVIVNGLLDVTRMRMQQLARLGYMDYCAVNELFALQRPAVPDQEGSAEEAAPAKAGQPVRRFP